MSETREVKISRLPLWAQREIERLEREVAMLEEKMAVGPDKADTIAIGWSHPDTPIGVGTTVRFRLDMTQDRTGYIEANITDGSFLKRRVLNIRSSETMQIVPSSSNSIYVFDRER